MSDSAPVSTTHKVVAGVVFLLLIPVVAMAAVMVSARMGDGPSVVFAGGPLEAGELVTTPEPDWSFVRDIGTIELQLLDPPKSRLIWIIENEGKAYVVSGYMGSFVGRLWKRWPVQAEEDGRAIIRVDGTRYARTLQRIRGGAAVEGVLAELRRKYGFVATRTDIAEGTVWLFELAPPSPGMSGAAE